MKQMQRRSGFAFAVAAARNADRNFRAGLSRAVALVVIVGALVCGSGAPWAWSAAGVAAIGVWQGVWLSWHSINETSPRDPLVRWAWRSAHRQHGHHRNNVAGTMELAASAGLSLVGPFGLTTLGLRLVAFAAAAVFVCSAAIGAFVDPAFYNPRELAPRWLEWARSLAGPTLVGLAALLATTAAWPAATWPALAVICMLPWEVHTRVREIDRHMAHSARQAEEVHALGRSEVVQAAHSSLSMPIGLAVRRLRNQPDRDAHLYDLLRLIRSQFQELTAMEIGVDVRVEWPGVLVRPIEALCRPTGVQPDIQIDIDELHGIDRNLARWALSDLVGNAVAAGAEHISVSLTLAADGRTIRLEVTDDAGPFPTGTWAARTGGLARLRHAYLGPLGGALSLAEPSTGCKIVTASWPQQHRGQDTTRTTPEVMP